MNPPIGTAEAFVNAQRIFQSRQAMAAAVRALHHNFAMDTMNDVCKHLNLPPLTPEDMKESLKQADALMERLHGEERNLLLFGRRDVKPEDIILMRSELK